MKFYIATRFSDEKFLNIALEIKKELEDKGHQITFNWMSGEDIKPYGINPEKTQKLAQMSLDGAVEADFFILIPEPNGTGMYVEFGAAIAQFEQTGKPKIFLLGEHKDCVLFNYHPAVVWKNTLEEIIEEIKMF